MDTSLLSALAKVTSDVVANLISNKAKQEVDDFLAKITPLQKLYIMGAVEISGIDLLALKNDPSLVSEEEFQKRQKKKQE